MKGGNLFSGTSGIVLTGLIMGAAAVLLQYFGNPANMGLCVACFNRDIAGAVGLHQAAVVQYLRPEIMGLGLGAVLAAFASGEFRPRGGSAPAVRFVLGVVTAVGALVFLGCPWRMLLRLAGGDGNALLGLAGLVVGIGVGVLFFKRGFSLGRWQEQQKSSGFVFPLLMLGLLALYFAFPQEQGQAKSGIISYSLSGPGSQHAPLLISLGIGLLIGAIAQRSRFCSMGAFRDLILFRNFHLFWGVIALLAAAMAANVFLGAFKPGFAGQPIAHTDGLWNFLGMLAVGLASALAGGCPGRQLFMAGEGDNDAVVFVLGLIVGAALSHNFGAASSAAGIGAHGAAATLIGIAVCLAIGLGNCKRRVS